jgi:hypothetical protein
MYHLTACASIIKNYSKHEQMTAHLSYSLQNMTMLRRVAKYQPAEYQVSQETTSYLRSLHVDYEEDGTPTLYDVPSSSIIELRGQESMLEISHKFMNHLLTNAVGEVVDHSLLAYLYKEFERFSKMKTFKLKDRFLNYLESIFEDPQQLLRIQHDIIDSVGPSNDYDMESIKLEMQGDFEELKLLLPIEALMVP